MAYTGGALQFSDFLNLWLGAVDPSFAQAFTTAGEGNGFEAYTQGFAQLARASLAVDVGMQSLYILPFSGQTQEPAPGAEKATVELTFGRTGRLNEPLVLSAGQVFFDEVAPDWGINQGITVQTGRRYTLVADLVFQPGQMGPLVALAEAERPGWGYNNPLPGNINLVDQPGAAYNNSDAQLVGAYQIAADPAAIATYQLVGDDAPDVLLPQHVGQYLVLTSPPAVAGQSYQATSYAGPVPPATGGTVGLRALLTFVDFTGEHAGLNGPFASGEICAVTVPGPLTVGYLTFLGGTLLAGNYVATFSYRSGQPAVGATVTGTQSGATMTVSQVAFEYALQPEPGLPPPGVSWQILDWATDWGLTVTNELSPTGGTAGVLDLLGHERNLPRISGEQDDAYRQRVSTIADVVTPNAVRRMLNRVLTRPYGITWCLREVGTQRLPGFFWSDGHGAGPPGPIVGDFFDYDAVQITPSAFAGTFQMGEQVTQQSGGGVVATGRILQTQTAGTLAGPVTYWGVAGIRGAFIPGVPIIGKVSGATVTPLTLAGGLDNSNRWRVYLDYLRFRAYFVVEVQRSEIDEVGFFWDTSVAGIDFWDAAPLIGGAWDGYALTSAALQLNALHAVDKIRAGGVSVDFFPAAGPCV